MVINIRGTNGSGKTHVVRKLLKAYEGYVTRVTATFHTKYRGRDKKRKGKLVPYTLQHHKIDSEIGPIYVIGPYDGFGGCDLIEKQDEITDEVRKYSKKGHVIFEGVIISTTYQRWADLAKELKDFKFAFLDTPKDLCIKRVIKRRLKKGNTRKYNPENLILHLDSVNRTKQRARDAGLDVNTLRHKKPLTDLLRLLGAIE
jgi:uridine kinase